MEPLKTSINLLQSSCDELVQSSKLSARENAGKIGVRKRESWKRRFDVDVPCLQSEVEDEESRPIWGVFQFREVQLDGEQSVNRIDDERSWIFDQDERFIDYSSRDSQSSERRKVLVGS